jgi:signal transduction histidine kinase
LTRGRQIDRLVFVVAFTFRVPRRWLDGGTGLFVLIALLTVLPAACVLWFMNDALTSESASARQRVLEAHRGQLRLVRARLDPAWRERAARLNADGGPEQWFHRVVTGGMADGAVVLSSAGTIEYPNRGGRDNEIVAAVEQDLTQAASLTEDARRAAVEMLAARLNDYAVPIAADDRLALMDRLRALSANVFLPTHAALRLSLELLGAERPAPVPGVVRPTAVPDVWALTSDDTRVIAFYRTGRLEAVMHDVLHEVAPAGIAFIATPPDVPADVNAIAAGPWLPGWQLSFLTIDALPFDADGQRRRLLYVSIALTGIAAMAIIGVMAAGTLRRHLTIARLKTDLVAAASHELRTPLASMRVLIDNLLADEHLDPVKTREYLEMLAGENMRLGRLVESFLTFARLDRNRQLRLAPALPAAIVRDAVDAVRRRLPEGADLSVDSPPDLPAVIADADAIAMALVNLLDNALKYSVVPAHVTLRVRQDDEGAVVFSVEDNGVGIPSREQRRIFRPFYRVDQRLARETGGVGLGLHIVDLIVRGHGGSVSVRSMPGAGSTFTLRLPGTRTGATA